MSRIAELGRLTHADEFEAHAALVERLGSVRRAFSLVKRLTGPDTWDAIRANRINDLLVYLALARFQQRPRIGALPLGLQRDIRDFFGTYKTACERADELLFQAGNLETIDAACRRSKIGKLLPNSLYVHESAVSTLEPLLRIYEGCARAYLGEIADANIAKLHRYSGKVSYLSATSTCSGPAPARRYHRPTHLARAPFRRGGPQQAPAPRSQLPLLARLAAGYCIILTLHWNISGLVDAMPALPGGRIVAAILRFDQRDR